MTFKEWAYFFKSLKKLPEDINESIEKILSFYQTKISKSEKWERQIWKQLSGYRKSNVKDRGEQVIERQLLPGKGEVKKTIKVVQEGKRNLDLHVTCQNFALTRIPEGQVICDAVGFIELKNSYRPVMIEVKTTSNDPWFAVVENIIQVTLARRNIQNIETEGQRRLGLNTSGHVRGAIGMVVAPKKYFLRKPEIQAAALLLITSLLKKTEIRIMLCTSDNLTDGKLEWVDGSYWPS